MYLNTLPFLKRLNPDKIHERLISKEIKIVSEPNQKLVGIDLDDIVNGDVWLLLNGKVLLREHSLDLAFE